MLRFGDSNLLVHKIRQLKRVASLDRIVVSSDSDVMLEMAIGEGVEVHRRAAEYAAESDDGSSKTFGELVSYVARSVEGDHIVWAQCTSPLVTAEIYEDAIRTYLAKPPDYDSLASVEPFQRHVWDDDGPVNYERGKKHVLSQHLPKWYFVTGVFIAPRMKMMEWSHNIGPNPYRYPLQKINCVDIDDELDLELARLWHDRACGCGRDLMTNLPRRTSVPA